jgi:ABC-2 type transport system ATP-binding protein
MFVKEYLLFAAETQGLGKSANKAVEEMIDKTGLTRERKKYIGQLSKGYKQRVGLAAAMLHNPKVLILDEPTSGLDPNQVGDMRNLIKEIGRDKTVILSTHIMQEVEAMCSRVVIINKGKIVADDNIVNLQKSMVKEFIIALELKSEIDKNLLMNIEGVTNVKAENNKYIIFASMDVREYVAALSSQNNWLILSMSLEEKSLEEVFQNLTN